MIVLIALLLATNLFAVDQIRSKIGPTLKPPVEYNKNIYFLATTGVLYKSDYKISNLKKLFRTDKSSVSGLYLDGSIVYFGEGIHHDKAASFYGYDLKKEKLIFKIKVGGHVERLPLVTSDRIYVGIGAGGLIAIDKKSLKIVWTKNDISKGKLHVDSSPVRYGEDLCFSSVYDFKGIVCLDRKKGDETLAISLSKSPRSEVSLYGSFLFGMAMEANLSDSKWEVPTHLYVIDLKEKKKLNQVDLRGYNFWKSTLVDNDTVFVSTSSGDLLLISLSQGKISYVGEAKEPITSNPFFKDNLYCAITISGKTICYKRMGERFQLALSNEVMETVIGEIGHIKGKYYAPTRVGYLIF